MKIIEVDEELYQYIARQTQSIGESASDILRRLLNLPINSSNTLDFVSFDNTINASAVKSDNVLTKAMSAQALQTQSEAILKKGESSAPKTVKKQSETAINQITDKVRALLSSTEFQEENKAVVRFLAILRVLYRTNPESFAQATEPLQGRTRVYFARDEATLLMAGNHTKPKQIPDTPYWVITNTNSGRKMLMLEGAMQSMDLPEDLINEVRTYFVSN
ncbi:replication initiation regulator SeqA [Rodentibacter caecimuris]|uniref:Negative modulator of initiation of replication n=1 Tax=Rodentibacter caecimuris TaxID=1796644 RepID=A0AAJ3MZH5_9PAST|nr:replication initiation negative regulator SeqA [Rodentibacter heylii]AOF52326.1 SeqA protein, negative modulator of initiation of replication [Pasteurellaceae bacterium NI1060]MCQ9122466.1 replication initiation negative regulator SeqA [Rodentibacter heylii]OOF72470.1 replication initiation regulator SeqA [Rodentibacter heylii]OOF73792.1 replication initiation regulator SeqA [Rodentibacter heylii]OOF74021.1 replication initiation regulator SeqA [Rodentibacter heylii]